MRPEEILKESSAALFAASVEEGFRTTFVSESVERLTGFHADEFLADPGLWRSRIHPEDRDRVFEELASVTDRGRYGVEYRFRRRDGRLRWLRDEGRLVTAEDERGLRLAGTCTDVTDRKRAEAELAASEASYRQLFDNLEELVYIQDTQGRFLDVNRKVLETYGYSREEILGQTPEMLAAPGRVDLAATMRLFKEALETGRPQRFEWWARTKTGRAFPKEVVLTRGEHFGRTVVIAVARDMTELRDREDQLRQAQKMEAIGRLAGGVAHDFNNVLTAITGFSDLLRNDATLAPDHREAVEEIHAASTRAAGLTRQLLSFSRRQVIEPELLDVNRVLGEFEGILQRLACDDLELRMELDPDLDRVEADRGQLEQIVMNLAINACDAMPGGGRLTISTSNRSGRGGSRVALEVRDTGAGIPPEDLPHIFEPFFTTKEEGKGTGLGLATVYGIVQQAGGRIDVESEVGRGSRFTVLLPSAGRPAAEPARTAQDPAGGRADCRRAGILVVEDEASIRRLLTRVLEAEGHRVAEASDGTAALRLAMEQEEPFDLLVTDVNMPRMRGPELAARLAARNPELRVLFISGYSEEIVEDPAGGLPNAEFLAKPFSPLQIRERVRAALPA